MVGSPLGSRQSSPRFVMVSALYLKRIASHTFQQPLAFSPLLASLYHLKKSRSKRNISF